MKVNIDIHVHLPNQQVPARLFVLETAIQNLTNIITQGTTRMSQTLDQVIQEVKASAASNLDAQNAAEEVLNAVPTMIQTAIDRVKASMNVDDAIRSLLEIKGAFDANTPELAAAIVKGTSAENTPPNGDTPVPADAPQPNNTEGGVMEPQP